MKAQLVIRRRVVIRENAFAEIVIWKVPQPVIASPHGFKYALAYVVNHTCVLRYDNEAGKGDHRHWGSKETSYAFVNTDTLLADFGRDIKRWNDENRDS